MTKIYWSVQANEDLTEIKHYIARDSSKYASLIEKKILNLCKSLSKFPKIGRVVPEYNINSIREKFYKNYRIIYEILDQSISILTIFHSSRKLR